ncbi:MAG: hypothetical protein C5B58_15610 [Acidobacteria bacterium]|nr:MAG: hypothetical protein C5B58_15610 [Acidobacteriota bacterium]
MTADVPLRGLLTWEKVMHTDVRNESKDELGRRLLAALLSYQLGLKSIDRTLKNHVGITR